MKRYTPGSKKALAANKRPPPALPSPITRKPMLKAALPPGLPPLSRLTAGHLTGALALAAVITGIYGVIAWGMFIVSGDFVAHISLAQRLYETGRLPAPHFLFHALTAALFAMHLAPSLVFAGRFVLLGCYALLALIMYGLLWILFQTCGSGIGRPAVLFLAGLATLLAEPITLSHAFAIGFLWPEPYVIPTSTMLKPFALASFLCAAWYLSRRCKIDIRLVSLFALATIAGSLSKPSFIICLLPASAILTIYRLVQGRPVSLTALVAGLGIPAAAVLAWQFYETYSGYSTSGMYHDSVMWAPFKILSYWATGLFSKFLLSILFPLVVAIVYWDEARRDSMLQLAWLCFLFGALYSYLLVEKANWAAGNFVWSGYITVFILFVASMVFWLRQAALATSRGWSRTRVLLCGCAIALHAISGARMDWLFLTHYGCHLNFRTVEFMCNS
jgi:hypothetical protein